MANRPISTPLPGDLPENWAAGQTVAPVGAEAGLPSQYGYNYQSKQINEAQKGVNKLNEAFDGLVPTTRKVNNKALSADITLTSADVGAEAALKGAAAKTTPVDADAVVITDSADNSKTKWILWSGIKSTLKDFFDSLYLLKTGSSMKGNISFPRASGEPSRGLTWAGPYSSNMYIREENDCLVISGPDNQLVRITLTDDGFISLEAENTIEMTSGGCKIVMGNDGYGLHISSSDDITFNSKPCLADGKSLFPWHSKNLSVQVSAWVANSTYAAQGFNWRAAVSVGATANSKVSVIFAVPEQVSGNFGPVESGAGVVYLYAKTKPASTFVLPLVTVEEVDA